MFILQHGTVPYVFLLLFYTWKYDPYACSLGASSYLVVLVVDRSTEPEAEKSAWRQNETTIGMIAISSPLMKRCDLKSKIN
jgi:hypothetical protein